MSTICRGVAKIWTKLFLSASQQELLTGRFGILMSTAQLTRRQLVARPLVVGVYALALACTGGEEGPPEPSNPPTGSYENFTPEELIRVFDIRESDVPVRELPGWAPPEKVVVVVPEEWDIREERMAFLQEVAPGVELIPVRNRRDALDRGVLTDAQVVLGLGCGASTVSAIGPETHWVQSGSVGVAGCFTSGTPPGETNRILRERNIVFTSIRSMTARAIAQHSLTIMLP